MTLAEMLNKYRVGYIASETGIRLEACPDDESLFDNEGKVIDAEFDAFLDKMDDMHVFADSNPKCGIWLVCFVKYNGKFTWYDELGEVEWIDAHR